MAYKGKFAPKNRNKYRGQVDKVTYRSLWELHVMKHLDANPHIRWWSSEESVIPYVNELDNTRHRYFMDFTVCSNDGIIHLWEVKPAKQTQPPPKPKRLTTATKERYINELRTYRTNISKWKAAKTLCDKKGWVFKILTEDVLRKRFGMKT